MTDQTPNAAAPSEGESRLPDLQETVVKLARGVARADSGSAAALRRGPLAGPGAAAFWKLLADLDIPQRDLKAWAGVAQAVAILTPVGSGRDESPGSAHDGARPMGSALFDAGISELRLARLLAAKGDLRHDLLIRTCRRLARDARYRRFDLRTLAWFLVRGGEATDQRIARDYYRAERRDHAATHAKTFQTEE